MKKLLIIVCSIFLFSCTTAKFVRADTVLEKNTGYLVCSIHLIEPGWGISIYNKDEKSVKLIPYIEHPWDVSLITLEEGDYTFGRIVTFPTVVDLEKKYFHIEAGKINYIGDLYLEWGKSFSNRKMYYIDKEESVLERLRYKYPYISGKYELNKEVLYFAP